MAQRAKKEVFGHFLEFGLLDRPGIAYCDRTKCFPSFGGSFKSHKNLFLNDPKSQKRGFWPFSWVWSVGST